jgi:hypothetical protein
MRRSVGAWSLAIGVLAATSPVVGCRSPAQREAPVSVSFVDEVPDSVWAHLATRRIFFGHQSVGGNLMDGVAEIARLEPRLGLRVSGDEATLDDGRGAFVHELIGRNGDPRLKTDIFAKRIEGDLGGRVDIAFHKYCYADLYDTTNVEAVFDHYRQTMDHLSAEHPGILFVYVTSPLQRMPAGPKAFLKRLLGRRDGRFAENEARERFNDLMRRTYGDRELFDLAALESTRPDGSREIVEAGGRHTYALVPGYTSDGSHLNDMGRRRIAERLLVFLARASESRGHAAAGGQATTTAARP